MYLYRHLRFGPGGPGGPLRRALPLPSDLALDLALAAAIAFAIDPSASYRLPGEGGDGGRGGGRNSSRLALTVTRSADASYIYNCRSCG